ncbi:ABC transporter ATP-binding protein [Streptococcus ovuberis]|uniref:ATP-binding cassette domain-containing protein n=1 Tax=Streptococcus ovuberis TaxID=1936207 RepID=A0A7X6N131_9STRE|nr:ATP-binding cassette domain-containing protein [Streptococcus ovuberis]NKZ21013.1 ATP-binding cassette domain-containing protein [Streptococcus ovuberis]
MQLDKVSKRFKKEEVLKEVSLEITPASFTAFIGPNGAGKSTLVSTMSRLIAKDSGYIWIKGQEVESWDTNALAKELSLLKQSHSFQTKLTVEELVSFGRYPHSGNRLTAKDEEKIQEALLYLGLEAERKRYIHTLSGGQLQRVFIAMVLAQDTELIFLDEPLNNLDMKQSLAIMMTLRQLVDQLGKTIVMVIHDINMASRFADEIVAFKEGEVFVKGKTRDVMKKEVLDALYDMSVTLVEVDGKQVCVY